MDFPLDDVLLSYRRSSLGRVAAVASSHPPAGSLVASVGSGTISRAHSAFTPPSAKVRSTTPPDISDKEGKFFEELIARAPADLNSLRSSFCSMEDAVNAVTLFGFRQGFCYIKRARREGHKC